MNIINSDLIDDIVILPHTWEGSRLTVLRALGRVYDKIIGKKLIGISIKTSENGGKIFYGKSIKDCLRKVKTEL